MNTGACLRSPAWTCSSCQFDRSPLWLVGRTPTARSRTTCGPVPLGAREAAEGSLLAGQEGQSLADHFDQLVQFGHQLRELGSRTPISTTRKSRPRANIRPERSWQVGPGMDTADWPLKKERRVGAQPEPPDRDARS